MKNNLLLSSAVSLSKHVIISLLLISSIFAPGNALAQKKGFNQYEIIIGGGPTNFLGELGGADNIGTHFFRDFNLNSTRFCTNAGLRYSMSPSIAVKSMLTYAMVSGSDNLTEEKCRHNRNLSFRSPIIELSLQGEFYFTETGKKNMVERAKMILRNKRKKFSAYFFSGVGIFYYSPQARYDDKWYDLRKLHTEGQGLPGGPKPYSNFSVCIPVGMGMKYKINDHVSFGAEFGLRKTFTDYLDDVSTRYYNKSVLCKQYGATSAALSDPGLGEIPGATNTSSQRGNPKYKDSYMFLSLNVHYKLLYRNRTRIKF